MPPARVSREGQDDRPTPEVEVHAAGPRSRSPAVRQDRGARSRQGATTTQRAQTGGTADTPSADEEVGLTADSRWSPDRSGPAAGWVDSGTAVMAARAALVALTRTGSPSGLPRTAGSDDPRGRPEDPLPQQPAKPGSRFTPLRIPTPAPRMRRSISLGQAPPTVRQAPPAFSFEDATGHEISHFAVAHGGRASGSSPSPFELYPIPARRIRARRTVGGFAAVTSPPPPPGWGPRR